MNTIENKMNSYQQPMYKIEVKAYFCSFEIEINDIPCFSYFDEPQIATDIPINNLIFVSGKQKVKFRMYPLYNNLMLHKDSKIELNVFVKESNDFYLKKQIVKSYANNESHEDKPFFENFLEFEAQVPYSIDTSAITQVFSNESEDELFSRVYKEYENLANLINNDDLKGYNKFTEIRFNDIIKTHYLDENKRNYYSNKALNSFKDYNLTLIPKSDYSLKFCFDDKLVYLQKMKNSQGLILEDLTSGEEQLHFVESAIFYKNHEGNLKLFR